MVGRGRFDESDSGRGLPGLLPWQVLLLVVVCGILALHFPVPGLAGCVLVLWAVRRLGAWPPFGRSFLLAAVFLLAFGYAWIRLPAPAPEPPQWMARGEKVMVSGVVAQVRSRYQGKLRVLLDQVRVEREQGGTEVLSEPLPGRLAWTWEEPTGRPLPGQTIRLQGRVWPVRWYANPGPGDYDFQQRTQGVYWRTYSRGDKGVALGPPPSGSLSGLRLALLDKVREGLPDSPGGATVLALLFGDRSGVDVDQYELMASAGLAHTLALSGLHVGFVVLLGFGLARLAGLIRPRVYLRVPRPRLGVTLAAPLVLAYLWLGEASPSLVRASVMFGFWGVLLLMGRSRVLVDGLFLAVALILAVTPLALFDLRLQYSALAVAGIAVAVPWSTRLQRVLAGPGGIWRCVAAWAAALLCISLAANLATLPLTAWYFGRLTPNLLLNVLWIPLLGLAVMPLAVSGLVLTAVLPGAGGWLLHGAAGIMDGMLWCLAQLAQWQAFPRVALLRPWWPSMLGLGLVLVAVVAALSRRRRGPDWALVLVGTVLLLVPSVAGLARDLRPEVRLVVLDVGKGQALVVMAPGGVRWVIDGGGSGSGQFDVGEGVVEPYLTHGRPPRLEGAVLTHPHLDHYQGVVWLLNNFQVRAYAHNGRPIQSSYKEPLAVGLARNGLEPVKLSAGQELVLNPGQGGDLVLETLHPSRPTGSLSTNDASLVLRLVWRGRPLALLPADVEAEGIQVLLASGFGLDAEVLVLPHHGSHGSLSPDLYRAVGPELAVASHAWGGNSELPAPEVRQVLDGLGIPLLTTAEQGMVEMAWSWDRPGFRVATFRAGPWTPGGSD